MNSSTQAAEQYYGYELQARRCLLALLQASPEDIIAFEVYEDVSIETKDGKKIHEQDTSSFSSNPVSNRSIKLWKTFYNWVKAIEDGTITINNALFILWVEQENTGEFSKELNNANSENDINGVITDILEHFKNTPATGKLKEYTDYLFDNSRILHVRGVIARFHLEADDTSTENLLREQIGSRVSEKNLIDTRNALVGWVNDRIREAIEKRELAFIQTKIFNGYFTQYIETHNNSTYLNSLVAKPSTQEITADVNSQKNYIKQLNIIDSDLEDRIAAAEQYLEASANRSKWARGVNGSLTQTDISSLDRELQQQWKSRSSSVLRTHRDLEGIEQGQEIHSQCMQYQTKVRGLDPYSGFIQGCFYTLSDEDSLSVGWHPDYKKIMQDENNE